MNIDCLGAGVSICPQLGGEYALTSNLGHCVSAVARINHDKCKNNTNNCFAF